MNPIEFADVIVVGGGSCGCVLASRLSENPDRSVLLLEAGPAFHSVADVPAAVLDASTLPIGPGSEWVGTYTAELAAGVSRTIARGRVLGGSGAVNGGYFVRATPGDFDAWPQSLWSFDQVLPFYIGSETDLDADAVDRWHGSRGPMPVSRTSEQDRHPLTASFVQAAANAGFRFHEDMNAPDAAVGGVGAVPSNIRNGTRVSAALAYLLPVIDRKNLRVQGNTTVSSLMFEKDRVAGVEIIVDGVRSIVKSDRVILSAGAVHTPALLLRSGIGPAESSVALGIPVISDNPGVGRGFSDHPEVAVPVATTEEFSTVSRALEAVLHSGDVEIRPYTRRFDRLISGLSRGPHVFGVGLMRSTARGSITLRSLDPFESPDVRYRYLESEVDRRAMREGVELARDLLASPIMSEIVDVPAIDDPLAALGTSLHLSGSAKMGPESDPEAVLDDHCRVRGVDGVLVVDTSAFPVVPSRGPHATAIMFAERAAALIADHGRGVEA
ncbi:mycofactocin system GMC family oxidoreductase MftG [Rhodococcus sp. 06-470-2]|uniref:mycofactocin dehydrogenase MftG n=1 Tax=unclassified Rhodococcus (in: high G+C Gram-positive bacteria) TaxID=192944 RepID=UPI000B9B683B|nr:MULTISPECIES: mycofactocin system GMC family oxidoreductase MftG [unclassified Rhodococcus (in: high G+C Gram-positive bacteria)]OZC56476.1 mycofactocin system GMC family oxidoreductase MftG [Rhodococcus sp. 06-470-2]OZE53995.1 mycofactocin system GMC family oxidoreductase MftG [Rhodococcus sp. 05-2221-1B]